MFGADAPIPLDDLDGLPPMDLYRDDNQRNEIGLPLPSPNFDVRTSIGKNKNKRQTKNDLKFNKYIS